MTWFQKLTKAVVAVATAGSLALPPPHPGSQATFNPDASLDASEAVFVPGQRWCPQLGTWDEEKHLPGKCLVDLVEGVRPVDRSRPDWDAAMLRCAAAGYTLAECEQSVSDGEF